MSVVRLWPAQAGRSAELVRHMDWAETPLGPVNGWPQTLRTAVDLVLDCPMAAIVLWGTDHVQIYNDLWMTVHPHKHPQAMGQRTHEAFPELIGLLEPIYRRVWRGDGVVLEDTLLPILRDGSLMDAWWNVTYTPVRGTEGAVEGIFCTLTEATAKVIAAHALQEGESRLRALVTTGSYLMYRMSPDWRVMYQLDSDTLAHTTEPIENWGDKYILEEDRPEVFAVIEQALRTKTLFELEHRVRLADGMIGWVLSRAVPILDAEGAILEWFGTGRDVTERKRNEANLAFLDRVSRGLALLSTPDEIMENVGAQVAEFLGLSGCLLNEVDEQRDEVTIHHAWTSARVPELRQTYRLADYSEAFRQTAQTGDVLVVRDTARDARVDAGAYAKLKVGAFVAAHFHWRGQ